MLEERKTNAARVVDCFAIMRRALANDIDLGEGESLPLVQYYALRALVERDRTAGELARAVVVSLPSLTQIVDGLVDRQCVQRCAAPHDRRKVVLTITPAGREVYERAREAVESRVADLLTDLNVEQGTALVLGLESLSGAIRRRWLATQAPEIASSSRRV